MAFLAIKVVKSFLTVWTLIRFLLCVCEFMSFLVANLVKSVFTVWTLIRFLLCMCPFMYFPHTCILKYFITILTFITIILHIYGFAFKLVVNNPQIFLWTAVIKAIFTVLPLHISIVIIHLFPLYLSPPAVNLDTPRFWRQLWVIVPVRFDVLLMVADMQKIAWYISIESLLAVFTHGWIQ